MFINYRMGAASMGESTIFGPLWGDHTFLPLWSVGSKYFQTQLLPSLGIPLKIFAPI